MDFGWVGFDNLISASDNGETDADVIKRRLYGSGQDDEGDLRLRAFKLPNTNSSCPKPNNVSEHRLPTSPFPFYNGASDAVNRSAGYYGFGGMSMQWGVRGGPFSPSQWMELEHQALIYKYITANVPIPSYLLNPIRKALDSSGFSLLRPNALGWGGFHLGFSNTDPEPGRCRRTDGKKWRCSRDAVPDQKYCERHMNRGRHRSRKPVEAQPGHIDSRVDKERCSGAHSGFKESEFGLVKPSENVIREFNRTQLSISIPSENEAGVNWVGGPLGEALHSTRECKNSSKPPLNLIDNWA